MKVSIVFVIILVASGASAQFWPLNIAQKVLSYIFKSKNAGSQVTRQFAAVSRNSKQTKRTPVDRKGSTNYNVHSYNVNVHLSEIQENYNNGDQSSSAISFMKTGTIQMIFQPVMVILVLCLRYF